MAIGIDELDEFELESPMEESTSTDYEPSQQTYEPQQEQDDFTTDFLASKGILDPSHIKFDDGYGNIVERNWDDLSREEQINILNTPTYTEPPRTNPDITQDEANFLNYLRSNNLTPSQYLESLQPQEQAPTYSVDSFSDDELYLLDLESRVGEMTEDEAINALNLAKQDEDLYNKQVAGIRQEYKNREEFALQQEAAEQQAYQEQVFNNYAQSVVQAIDNFNAIGNLDLNFENQDKEELAEFMLTQDEAGNNYFASAMQNPDNVVKAAWFLLNGEDAFNSVNDYFINEIKRVSDYLYRKGFEDAQKGIQSRPSVVINQRPSRSVTSDNNGKMSIYDLPDE